MLNKIDHIGIAVQNLDSVLQTLQNAFDMQPTFIEEVEEQKVRVAGYTIGESIIEYIEPSAADSPISRFLDTKNNAIHHISYRVTDINVTLQKLKEKGFQLIDEEPKMGANGKKIAFLHPKSFNGILIELCEVAD